MQISEPVIVAVSQPNETRWGYYQFPAICRLPNGEIMVTVNNTEDATSGYGDPLLRFLSRDDGYTWRPVDQTGSETLPPSCCSEVFNGEYLTTPSTTAFDVAAAGIHMPELVGKTFAYQGFYFYRAADCPFPLQEYLQHIPALRWTPGQPAWTTEQMTYTVPDALCWTFGDETAVSRTWLEHAPILHNGELLYVDYRTPCLLAGGSVPQGFCCLLMSSADNGRSFRKRSLITAGRVYEPILADTRAGELVCIIRSTDQEIQPMWITHSQDHGFHWESPQPLFDFGVFPALVRMGSGALLLSFGRPGVWVSASLDGSGRSWTEPAPVIPGSPDDLSAMTCGYTGLLPVSEDEALLVYSNFVYRDAANQQHKSIEVRRINLSA